jgi:hypothetical protein
MSRGSIRVNIENPGSGCFEDEDGQPLCAWSVSSAIIPYRSSKTKNAGRPKPPCIQSCMPTILLAEA